MSTGVEDWKRWPVAGVFPLTCLEVAAAHGHEAAPLLERAGIRATPAEIFEVGLTLGQHVRLMDAVRRAVDDSGFGLEVGWRLPPTALGHLGLAMLSSPTIAEALELLQRFWHLVGRPFALAVETEGEVGLLDLRLRLPAFEPHRTMFLESVLTSIHRGVSSLAPDAARQTETWFDFPEPTHAPRVRARLPHVRYDMPATQLRFPVSLLGTPLAMANPVGLRTAIEQCEREEAERGLGGTRLVVRVQSELKSGPSGYPDLEQMARRLHTTSRTLRRHLQREGTRYSELLEEARRRDALRLLGNRQLGIQYVAEMLGYEDPANFTRAFRRWTGRTPTQYRNDVRS